MFFPLNISEFYLLMKQVFFILLSSLTHHHPVSCAACVALPCGGETGSKMLSSGAGVLLCGENQASMMEACVSQPSRDHLGPVVSGHENASD